MLKKIWTDNLQSATYQDALAIRYKVFVDEQKVPSDLEIDEFENTSLHLVLYKFNQPIATARMYPVRKECFKVQRVAVLKKYRGSGIGSLLMKEIEQKAVENKATSLTLGSQNSAIPFYKQLGYTITSEEFMDAGIPHHTMSKILDKHSSKQF